MDHQEEARSAERSPLLRPARPARRASQVSFIPRVHSPHLVVFLLFCAIFVMMFGNFFMIAPQLRVYEDIICRHYYDEIKGQGHIALTEEIDESLCKVDEIQEELAVIVGGLAVVDSIPGLLFALPYGVLADRIGRKPVFYLALTGIILSQGWILAVCWFWTKFPLRLVWLNPVFQAIGGGNAIVQSAIFALVSDVSTEANRANHFFWVGCGAMASEFISPSIASSLMTRSPWIPLTAGIGIVIFGSLFMLFVPETLHQKPTNGSTGIVAEIWGSSSSSSAPSVLSMKRSLLYKFKENFVSTFDTLRVYASPTIFILLATFSIQSFGRLAFDLVMRYISKRFSWSLAETGFLLSLRAGINVILFLAILPGVSYVLTSSSSSAYSIPGFRFNMPTTLKDLVLARFSLFAQIIGFIFLALSAFPSPIADSNQDTIVPLIIAIAGMVVYTLGMGFGPFCRSLISTLVDQEHIARLYAVLSIIDTVGASIIGPALAWLYSWGLKLSRKGERSGYLGLPFWGSLVLTAIAGGGIMFIKAPERRDDNAEEENVRIAESELQAELLM